MMELDFDGYQIRVTNEADYDIGSVDNVFQYQYIYQDDENCPKSLHGIKIYKNEQLIASALVASCGGGTGVYENSVLIDDKNILICCGNSIFCLDVLSLKLLWRVNADIATCFEIFAIPNGYIVHGELEITKLSKIGNIDWQFGGADIFVRQNIAGGFEIKESSIVATDWNNDVYEIGFDGELISEAVKAQVSETAKSKLTKTFFNSLL
jgi:hypothetical protein